MTENIEGASAPEPAEIESTSAPETAGVFVLGGNGSTLALINSFAVEDGNLTAHLVSLAWTPVGVTIGTHVQSVRIELPSLPEWIDRNFPPEDERAFVAPVRDIELLVRLQWQAPLPEKLDAATIIKLDETAIINLDDVPDEVVEALAHPAQEIVQCAICRRLCVKGDFIWKERELCAWDYHAQAFGKRGPWHNGPYEDRHFETVPHCAYVATPLLEERNVEAILATNDIAEPTARAILNLVLTADPQTPHLAVKTPDGYTLLRETPA